MILKTQLYICRYIYICIVNSSPGLWSVGVLNHFFLRLEPSNGRNRRFLRARRPQDHLHSRQHVIDDFLKQDPSLYTDIFIYLFVDNISPGLQSLGVLNHVCLGLEPSNGRDRRCLRARGPQDHHHSRPPGTDEHIISKAHLYIYIYIYMDNSSPGL